MVEGARKECCHILEKEPAQVPFFCRPTVTWCEYQAMGSEWSKMKKNCCINFGDEMSQCQTAGLINMPALVLNLTIPEDGTFHIKGDSEYAFRNLTSYSDNIPTLTPDLL